MNQKGCTGKSTSAINLAGELVRRGKKVLIVDTDTQGNATSNLELTEVPKITLSDIVPPASYTIAFDGSGGVAGFGKGNAQVKLEPLPTDAAGQASCELHYTVHATVGGKIAQLGQRLIDGAAKSMAEDFFKRFDDEMQRRFPRAEPLQADTDAVTQPGRVEGGDATQGGGIPAWVWGVGAGALVLLAWWFNRG